MGWFTREKKVVLQALPATVNKKTTVARKLGRLERLRIALEDKKHSPEKLKKMQASYDALLQSMVAERDALEQFLESN